MLNALVIVAALGYFVDIYDLVLFSIVRVQSLQSLGLTGDAVLQKGVLLLNMQMAGMLAGGILWGVLGDKWGRLKVLFGSIILYSLANIANGFVGSVETYAICRFIAGVGLAGELGAGITLVSETLPKEKRGYATMIVASVGVSGAVFAGLIAEYFDWRTNFWIGGVLGLLLLALRVQVAESGMFKKVKSEHTVRKGQFFKLFSSWKTFGKYARCILIGVPLWYIVGILVTFSPELSQALGATGTVNAGRAIMFCYFGLVIGDCLSGVISQLVKSRKKAVKWFLMGCTALVAINFFAGGLSPTGYYAIYFSLGVAAGYWAVFVTIGAEQFGTNLRSTVATTVPNFVRGAVVPLTLAFQAMTPKIGIRNSAAVLAVIVLGMAYIALKDLDETYGKELDFIEAY